MYSFSTALCLLIYHKLDNVKKALLLFAEAKQPLLFLYEVPLFVVLYGLGVVKSAALTSSEGGVVLHRIEVAIFML